MLRLCRLDELPDRGARGFDPLHIGQDTLFIVRRGDALYGWRNATRDKPPLRI
jgi:hypothetical protein